MSWQPEGEELKWVKMIQTVSLACLIGDGTDNRETFIDLIKTYLDLMERGVVRKNLQVFRNG